MQKINTLSIDVETFSDVDLAKSGVYRYAESQNFEILLLVYSVNGGEVQVVDLACGEKIPDEILQALSDTSITKWAFNAAFERVCLSAYLRKHYPQHFSSYSINEDTVGDYLDPYGWKCSMTWAAYMGLPQSLKEVGTVLELTDQKMDEGKALIRYFSMPNRAGERNLPSSAPEKWAVYKEYNKRDVQVEMAVQHKLRNFPVLDFVWEEYWLDQEINDRGIAVDMKLANNAVTLDTVTKEQLTEELKRLTALENPNSVAQMKQWLFDNGIDVSSLGKKDVQTLIATVPSDIAEVLKLRQQTARSSVKKYQAMQNAVCRDSRARGMFRFYGANRTGRWSGKIIQLQNLPQNHMTDLEQARTLVQSGNFDAISMLYDNIPDVLSQLIRTAFVPRDGMKLIVADFSAIEARVLSHIAGEKWRIKTFADGGDIYCASASQMFGVPVEKHGENAHLRQKGKIAELALGYGGSIGALEAMGALDMGLTEEELQPLVNAWRSANPHIVKLWWDVDRCVKQTVKERIPTQTHDIRFIYKSGMLFIELPSGRRLSYVKPRMGVNRFGGESVTYMGIGTNKKWERLESYGPKFVENIVQAISRDILCYAMRTLSNCFIVGHVHDEIIIECDKRMSAEAVCEQMGSTPPWIEGLNLRADGYKTMFYKKD